MCNQLQGKVSVITGGGSGIGRASVLRFLSEGAQVVVLDINEKSGLETIEIARKAGYDDSVRFRRCDVSNEPEMESAIKYAVNEFGRLDCMFNNAGLSGAVGPITKTKVEDWDRTCAVLLRGVFIGTQHAALAMGVHKEGGTVINTSSIAGLSAGAGGPAYSSCKAAVINFTRSAAVELAAEKIRVNAICPGAILTPLVHRGHETEVEQVFSKGQPWPESGRPEHIANVALFLATDQSRFITGEYITVDGGLNALGPGLYAGANPAGNAIIEKVIESLGITIPENGEMQALFDTGNTGL
jgi:NAD(P)-dependent dehydrogenase (short-subunit alcohol dehydrogenase family)